MRAGRPCAPRGRSLPRLALAVLSALLFALCARAVDAAPPGKPDPGENKVEKIEDTGEPPAKKPGGDGSEDIVETLDDEPSTSGPKPAEKKPEPEAPKPVDKFEFRGFTRLTLGSSIMRDLQREVGVTRVMVTHDAHLAARADNVVRLLDGRVVDTPTAAPADARALVGT